MSLSTPHPRRRGRDLIGEVARNWACLPETGVLIHYLPSTGAPVSQPGPGPRKSVSFREKILAAHLSEEVNSILQLTLSVLKLTLWSPCLCIYTTFSAVLKLRRRECFKCWAPKHHPSLSHLFLGLDEKWATKINNPTQRRASCPGPAKRKCWI